MDDHCAPKAKRAAPVARPNSHAPCPRCGVVGRPVPDETLRAMLPATTALGLLVIERRYCKTQSCDVLYYGDDGRTVSKSEARVRVGSKEADDPAHLCYCFDVTRSDLRKDVAENGESKLLLRIKGEVREGNCACVSKKPWGACCLGAVGAFVTDEKRRLSLLDADHPANDEARCCAQACCGE
ncbi:MAG: hypothetical protein NVS3B20_16450 [Polyangiales bacterium]